MSNILDLTNGFSFGSLAVRHALLGAAVQIVRTAPARLAILPLPLEIPFVDRAPSHPCDRHALAEAVKVARHQRIDMDIIRRWSDWEWARDRFEEFERALGRSR